MEKVDYEKRFKILRNRLILLFAVGAAILIATLIAVNFRTSSSLKKKEDISALINISGRQRMLSQRIAKQALLILDTPEKDRKLLESEMDSLLHLFRRSHYHLVRQNRFLNSKRLDEKFEVINPILDSLLTEGRAFLNEQDQLNKKWTIINLESKFLPIMEGIVKEYEVLNAQGYISTNDNLSLSNYSIILLILVSCIVASWTAIRIVRNYSIELTGQSVELRETQIELEKTKVKEQFAYVASHDLQEPVRTMISLTELLQESHESDLNEEGKQIVQFMYDSSNRMARLIKGLLDYSRLGKNQGLEKIDLNQILQNIEEDLNSQILENKATIKYPELPSIVGYKLDIRSIFQNLISNAIKFSSSSEISLIEISFREDVSYWFFDVRDNGIGIAQKDVDKIFQIFQRLHNRNKYEGVGIGLAHCKRIVEIHRGSISVDSKVGLGSTFKFSISKRLV